MKIMIHYFWDVKKYGFLISFQVILILLLNGMHTHSQQKKM